MIKNEFLNRVGALFPGLKNEAMDAQNVADANGNTLGGGGDNLWKTVSAKSAESVRKILAPVQGLIMDVSDGLSCPNPNATPTVQVEVIKSMGEALVNPTDFEVSAIEADYVDVKTALIARPFKLSVYDIMHGERIEGKLKAAMEAVAQGVVGRLNAAIAAKNIEATELTGMSPETAAELSGAFDTKKTHALTLTPAQYAKLIPTTTLALNPEVEGTFGIGHIYSSAVMPSGVDAYAITEDAIAGAVTTAEIVEGVATPGVDVQFLGYVGGIPMVLRTQWDFNQTLKCSVECLAGFVVTDAAKIKTYTVA